MGGDFAPECNILGVQDFLLATGSDVEVVLIGKESEIAEIIRSKNGYPGNFRIVHAENVLSMGDDPVNAIKKGAGTSIVKGFELLAAKKIDAFVSAGNSGAMSVGAMHYLDKIEGVIRPCMPIMVNKVDGEKMIILDSGLNVDCRPEVLHQFAQLGTICVREILGKPNPTVALLNIGEEPTKGNLHAKAAYKLLSDDKKLNFVGNIEASRIFDSGTADVIVTDGFVGNAIMKVTEGVYRNFIKGKMENPLLKMFDFELYGGSFIMGISSPVCVGHGISSPLAVRNMLVKAENIVRSGFIGKIQKAIEEYE